LGACTVIAVLLLSNVSWAQLRPRGTYFSCKCTCRYEDELGKEHFGPSGAVAFTESTQEKCLGHHCTVQTNTGTYTGSTRNCTATEKTAARIEAGSVPVAQPLAQPSASATTQPPAVKIPGSIPGAAAR
jgi:hypothetical protein